MLGLERCFGPLVTLVTSAALFACQNTEQRGGATSASMVDAPASDPNRSAATDSGVPAGDSVAVCSVARCGSLGCVDQTAPADCEGPLPSISWARAVGGRLELTISGDTRCGKRIRASEGCDTNGAAIVMDVDLELSPGPLLLIAELDSTFDGSLRLDRGECADPITIACNEDFAVGVDRSVLTQELEPGSYRLIVSGERSKDAGEFELKVTVLEPNPTCVVPPVNDTCASAIDLDPDLPVQAVVGSTRCGAHDAFSRFECAWATASTPDVFYRLDLSERKEPVVLAASTDLGPTNFDSVLSVMDGFNGQCFSTLTCNDDASEPAIPGSSELVTLLSPAEYFIAVDSYDIDGGGEFGLLITLDEVTCATNTSCQTAIELEASVGDHHVEVDTACATSVRSSACGDYIDTKDVFYRLNLEEYEGPLEFTAELEGTLSIFMDGVGDCGVEVICDSGAWTTTLQPAVYYLMASIDYSLPTPLPLDWTLKLAETGSVESCVDEQIANCAAGQDCCDLEATECLPWLTSCGLAPEVRDCVCEAEPACCRSWATLGQCQAAFESCGLYCDGFDIGAYCKWTE